MRDGRTHDSDVCVVGGGPAGIMLALLLAREGTRVTVLEKHPDFLRDFRGDTVHPSTVATLDELGLADRFLALPHRKVDAVTATFDDGTFKLADFSRLPGRHRYLVFVPQWDFLEFLTEQASAYPGFTLLRATEATGLVRDGGVVCGVSARSGTDAIEVRARLTVAADGRDSTVRRLAGLEPREFGAPMDVLWFRVSRHPRDPVGVRTRVGRGRLLLLIDRGQYWQAAYVIRKGGYAQVRAEGLGAFRHGVAALAGFLAQRTDEIGTWDDVRVLSVRVDRLSRWHAPGLLLIGDAAHAMSPIGGVGINLAVQDAVATARILAPALRHGGPDDGDLARVQRRRWLPTVATQTGQRLVQRAFLGRVLASERALPAPRALRLLQRLPVLQGLPARLIGIGGRPEHVRTRRRRRQRR